MSIWQKLIALLISFCAAGLITFAISYYFESKKTPENPSIFVLVSKTRIPVGKKLSKESLKWIKWESKEVPKGYIVKGQHKLSTVIGKVVADNFIEGEPILLDALVESKNIFATKIAPGKRAFTFVVSKKFPIISYLRSGNLIDIIVDKGKSTEGKTILSAVKILDVNEYFESSLKDPEDKKPSKKKNKTQEITVELTPEEIERLLPYSKKGNLVVSLHSSTPFTSNAQKHKRIVLEKHPQTPKTSGSNASSERVLTVFRGLKKDMVHVKN